MNFSNPFAGNNPDKKLTKEELVRALREMIAAEMEAANLYTQLADALATINQDTEKILRSIAAEELVHVGEFRHALHLLSPEDADLCKQGIKEAEKLLKTTASDEGADTVPAKRKLVIVKDQK
jgi:rubrerythrin